MDKDTNTNTNEYEAPRIADHGDLTELTAAAHKGWALDATYPAGTPLGKGILTSTP
jgi:hypothetical protein